MSLFNDIPFSQHSGNLIKEAIGEITAARDPIAVANAMRTSRKLDAIGIQWETLVAKNVGSDILVDVATTGDPQLFTMRVSTSVDPLPNARLNYRINGAPTIQVHYSIMQGERTILSALDSFRRVAQQHVDFVNQAIMRHNAVLLDEIDKTLRIRRTAVDEAARVVEIINTEQTELFASRD